MTTPKENNGANAKLEGADPSSVNPFKLERVFEEVSKVFKPNKVGSASSDEVMIAVDTNVLLLPYTIRKDGLPALQDFYEKLRGANRLFLPARVAREFINNRDTKLAELLKMLGEVKSRINIGEKKLSPILDGVEGSEEMSAASQALTDAKKQYTTALEKVEARVQAWNGDDPVTTVYDAVFDESNIISPNESEGDLLTEWKVRLKERVPPGYKDGGKEDTGIGDFLIWKSLLTLGKTHQKDLIFVTGDEKADWFVRLNNKGAYPRPELVAEYRKHSQGKNIKLVEFHEVLREMQVSPEIVNEVESAEITANSLVRASPRNEVRNGILFVSEAMALPSVTGSIARFRLPRGGQNITFKGEGYSFTFSVSEQTLGAIWAYPNGRDSLTVLSGVEPGLRIDVAAFKAAEEAFSVVQGDYILVRDNDGAVLIARLVAASESEGTRSFELTLSFSVFRRGSSAILP